MGCRIHVGRSRGRLIVGEPWVVSWPSRGGWCEIGFATHAEAIEFATGDGLMLAWRYRLADALDVPVRVLGSDDDFIKL